MNAVANDNGKASTASEVTRLADAIFNKVSAIRGAHASDEDRLFGELAGLITRAGSTPKSRSKDANALLANAIDRAHDVALKWCEIATA
jgi:hypothetical protein